MIKHAFPTILAVSFMVMFSGSGFSADHERAFRDAVKVARQLTQSDDRYDQIAGAGTLVDVGDRKSLQVLTDFMNHDDWTLQRSAIDMMMNVLDPAGLNLIYRMASIRVSGVFLKFVAESAASRPREDMAEFLMATLDETEDQWVKKLSLQALAFMTFDDKEARITAFAENEAADQVTRAYAYYALMDTPAREKSLAKLLQISTSGTPHATEAAAVALGLVNSDETKAALKKLRDSDSRNVQIAAMASEAGLGIESAISLLIDTVIHGTGLDSSVAAASIRRVRADIAVQISDTLMTEFDLSSDSGTRLVESWAWIDADPKKIYAWGLNHKNPDIRMQSAWLVGQREDREYLDAIIPMLEDEDSGIRGMAAWTIVRMLASEYDSGVEI
jgi:HEAT repeat protein